MKSSEEIIKELCDNIEKNYHIIAKYHLNEEKNIILSDGESPKRCRFCGKAEPEVTFDKVAHAISHMVENRFLKSDYECDVCNGRFSVYESDYSQYMNLYHTLFKVHGKGGVPKFKNGSRNFSGIETTDGKEIHIKLKEDEESLVEWSQDDKDRNLVKIKGKRSYTPQNVLRAIIKMALSVMPKEEMQNFDTTIDWLLPKPGTKIEGIIYPVLFKVYRTKLPFTSCFILKKKEPVEEKLPQYMFVLVYANIYILTAIPFVKADDYLKDQQGSMPIFPCPLDYDQKPISSGLVNLSGIDKIKGEEVSVSMHYDSFVERTISNSNDEGAADKE